MEDEISCDDPQFMNMLETCLRVEIEGAKSTLSVLEKEIKELKGKVQLQLQTRRQLKEGTKNAQENIQILNAVLNKENKCLNEISNNIELVKLNLDNDYKVMKQQECELYENIYKEYETLWQSYHAKYEEFPLARDRKEAKIKLEKIRVDEMILEYKVNDMERISRQQEWITWLRMRAKIIELARAILNYMKQEEKLKDLNRNIEDRKQELNVVETELATRLKRQEEEKRDRALKLLEMPPPKINFSHMRTIYGHKPKIGFLDGWERNYENSIDTLSVDTLMLEEMCIAGENSLPPPEDTSTRAEKDQNLPYDQPIDSRSPSLDQEQQEVEHEDTASEADGNTALEPIDAVDEEVEQRMDQELEHLDQPPSLSKDKQTGQRCVDLAKVVDDPPVKRMRLICDKEKPVASPMKNIPLEREKAHFVDPPAYPRISKIETVRYSVSPFKKAKKIDRKDRQLVNQTSEFRMRKMSSARKIDQDNPNPSSMFTPCHYDYSDDSDMSFCVDNTMADLKDDQISLYGGSVRDFCECSNVSTPNENAAQEINVNASSTSKTHSFPQSRACSSFRIRGPLP
ncbi:PREDICTED: golgin subfamily A member 6-like protein 22 [Eufriesea mexicana]|uniref:golgin subfamily A member 6-like protein 22 n=1 Tax=Eufriesea mexicana TaxID=516756 RepID=UPI00083BE51E|nr:PREDICTED: golgin subfamily A member 6-like protein 22 [Eufriesea mexicana]